MGTSGRPPKYKVGDKAGPVTVLALLRKHEDRRVGYLLRCECGREFTAYSDGVRYLQTAIGCQTCYHSKMDPVAARRRAKIVAAVLGGESGRSVAKRYRVSPQRIYKIIANERRKLADRV